MPCARQLNAKASNLQQLDALSESSEGYLTDIGDSELYHKSWDTPQKTWDSNLEWGREGGGVVRGLQILIINIVGEYFSYNFAGDTSNGEASVSSSKQPKPGNERPFLKVMKGR